MKNIQTGKKGEQYAAHYLISKGYKIITTNYKVLGGEIDIIARYNLQLIFIEVKTRRGKNFGLPEDALGYHKLRKIKYTMFKYMHDNYYRGPFRIDLIAIELGSIDELKHLRHYKDVQLI
jgi:putative endonuclease